MLLMEIQQAAILQNHDQIQVSVCVMMKAKYFYKALCNA